MADQTLDRHIPEHPLPSEIQKMDKDDTVCKFCGVSYLIHHEMKLLEERVKAAEEELKFYKGAVERETKLKEEVRRYQQAVEEYRKTLKLKEALISTLTLDSKVLDDEILDLKKTKQVLEDKMVEAIRDGEKYKSSHTSLVAKLPDIQRNLTIQKSALIYIRAQVKDTDKFLQKTSKQMNTTISEFCQKQKQDTDKFLQETSKQMNATVGEFCQKQKQVQSVVDVQVSSLQAQNSALQEKDEQFRKEREDDAAQIKHLKQIENEFKELQQKHARLERDLQASKDSLEKEISKTRMVNIQAEQYKEQLNSKTKEFDNILSAGKTTEKSLAQSIDILQEKLRSKETEWREAKAECLKFMRQTEEHKARGDEINRKAAMTQGEREELKQSLLRSQDELMSLKAEREAMITSHQNRIEQLRESFKNKMAEAEKWPEKMEEMLRREREKHAQELQSLEEKLRENFVMEMQIEKQKHQQLIDRYSKEAKETENKLKSQLVSSMHNTHQAEVEDLQRLLKETRERAKAMEDQLRAEIESLKKIIKDLQERLGRVDLGSQEKVVALQLEGKEKDAEIANLKDELGLREKELANLKEDVSVLQDTVRRECEERFELTEALGLAREELLTLKKPAGGYQTPVHNSRTSSVSSVSEQSRRGSLNNGVVLPPHPPAAQMSQREPVNSTTMGFEGEAAVSASKNKFKGKSMNDSRKRIAAAVGRP